MSTEDDARSGRFKEAFDNRKVKNWLPATLSPDKILSTIKKLSPLLKPIWRPKTNRKNGIDKLYDHYNCYIALENNYIE